MEQAKGETLFGKSLPERRIKIQPQVPQDSPDILTMQQSSVAPVLIIKREVGQLERLKGLDAQISGAINKVKSLKEDKLVLEQRVKDLEARLNEKEQEVLRLSSDKAVIKSQIEELLGELDTLEVG